MAKRLRRWLASANIYCDEELTYPWTIGSISHCPDCCAPYHTIAAPPTLSFPDNTVLVHVFDPFGPTPKKNIPF